MEIVSFFPGHLRKWEFRGNMSMVVRSFDRGTIVYSDSLPGKRRLKEHLHSDYVFKDEEKFQRVIQICAIRFACYPPWHATGLSNCVVCCMLNGPAEMPWAAL